MMAAGESVLFWILATVAVAGALGVVAAPRAVYSALCLAATMVSLAVLYMAQGAVFLGVGQIVVYTGAVMMLFLFVVMLIGVESSDSLVERIRGHRVAAIGAKDPAGGVVPAETAELRFEGYRSALAAAGHPLRPELVSSVGDFHRSDGAAAAQVVGHVHYHLIPRPELRAAGRHSASFTMFGRGVRSELDDDEGRALAARLRAAVADAWATYHNDDEGPQGAPGRERAKL